MSASTYLRERASVDGRLLIFTIIASATAYLGPLGSSAIDKSAFSFPCGTDNDIGLLASKCLTAPSVSSPELCITPTLVKHTSALQLEERFVQCTGRSSEPVGINLFFDSNYVIHDFETSKSTSATYSFSRPLMAARFHPSILRLGLKMLLLECLLLVQL